MVTQTQPVVSLSSNENKAIREFLARTRLNYGEKIQRAALFGSKARGDSTEYSDIDILLIVADEDWKFQQALSRISSDISLEYDVLLDIRVISVFHWQYLADIRSGLYQNITRDAVPLE